MKIVLALSVITASLMGCQSMSTQPQETAAAPVVSDCYFYGAPDKGAPAWICSAEADREAYVRSAIGFSANTAGGIVHQKNLAIQQGQKELADQVKSEIIASIKSKTGTLGVDGQVAGSQATSAELNSLTNVVLEGVETLRTMRGPDGYFYVHVALPHQAFKQNVDTVVDKFQQASKALMTVEQNQKLSDDIAKALASM